MENLYLLLQVNEKASKSEIEKAYKKLVKRYHPDIAKDKQKAEEIMKKINNAYDVLGDEAKRKEYNLELLRTREMIKQRESKSSGVSYSNDEYYKEDLKQKYNSYYNNNQQTNNYQRYNVNNNMYEDDNNGYYDYINDFNIFRRFFSLSSGSKKVFLLVILIIALCFYNVVLKIKREISNISSSKSSEIVQENNNTISKKTEVKESVEYIDDQTPGYEYTQFISKLKYKQIYILNNYLKEQNKFTDNQLTNLIRNSDLLSEIASSLTVNLKECNVTTKGKARVTVEVNRIDISSLLLNISYNSYLFGYGSDGFNMETIDIKQELLKAIESGSYKMITKNDTVWLEKENDTWKILFSVNNMYNLFGIDLTEEI